MKTPQERAELAAEYKKSMNCCQAVVKAFADTVSLDEQTLHQIGSGFGSGMGTTEATCGALVGAGIIAGLRTKEGTAVRYTREIHNRFKTMCGATICKELKGIETGKVLCKCEDCVRNAVIATEESLRNS